MPETNMTLSLNWNLNKNFKQKVVSTILRYFSKCFSVNLFNIQNHPGRRYNLQYHVTNNETEAKRGYEICSKYVSSKFNSQDFDPGILRAKA